MSQHTALVRGIKQKVKSLPCLGILHPLAFLIVETNASDLGHRAILKQKLNGPEQLVRHYSGIWLNPQTK